MKKIICLLLPLLGASFFAFSQNEQFHLTNPKLGTLRLIGISRPLTELTNADAPAQRKRPQEKEGEMKLHPVKNPNALPRGVDPAIQYTNSLVTTTTTATINLNLPGLGYTGVNPSDNNIASGPNHVVEMINNSSSSLVRIWDKAGNVLVNSLQLSTVTGHGGFGDPVVLYDYLADRWLLSEFGSSGNHIYICVSQTNNPTGTYFVYDFNTPQFPDYFKLAAWGNSYIITTNESTPAVYAVDRTRMLAGNSTTAFQRFTIPAYPTIGFQAATPVDFSGTAAPAAGTPAMVMRMADDAWTTGIVDRLEIFNFNVDWTTPANTTLTGPVLLPTLPFSTNFCGYTTFSCIVQQGSSIKLDPLREVLMNKVIYRNFGTYEAIVCTHVNELDGTSHAGVRWYELRKTPPATDYSIYQQGTYGTPADPLNRWMSCIAINSDGSIALGYNVAGTTSFPSVRFTGRRACDPLNTMTEPEQTIIAGTSPNGSNRYGDYNGMTVDPVNGSFWITSNYNPASQWATRVANISIDPNCSGGCNPVITSQPSNAAACVGSTVNYSVVATGTSLSYQWQVSTNGGGSFSDIAGATLSTYSFSATAGLNGNQYRCVVTGTCAPTTVTSNAVTLTITQAPAITTQPVNVPACAGGNASFSLAAAGAGLSYQWQISTNGGSSFSNIVNGGVYSGATTGTLGITGVTPAMNGYQFRCIVSGACAPAANSNVVTLTVNTPVTISVQPVNKTVCPATDASFSVTAAGTTPSYQWQLSTNGGASFSNISGATASTLTLTAVIPSMNGYIYRCVVGAAAGCNAVNSGNATLTVLPLPAVNATATATSVCAGTATTLTATGASTYVWAPAGTGTSAVVTVTPTVTTTYTVTGTDVNGCTNSKAITITATPKPAVSLTAAPYTRLVPALTTTITAAASSSTATAFVYNWSYSGTGTPGSFSGNTKVVGLNALGTYTITAADAANLACISLPASITISDSASDRLFIYPSPNDGLFHVAYYNPGGTSTSQTVTVFDSEGRKVFSNKFTVALPYQILDIDLRCYGAGVYIVVLGDSNGKKLKTGKVEIR